MVDIGSPLRLRTARQAGLPKRRNDPFRTRIDEAWKEMAAIHDVLAQSGQLKSLRADISKGVTTAKQLPEFRARNSSSAT